MMITTSGRRGIERGSIIHGPHKTDRRVAIRRTRNGVPSYRYSVAHSARASQENVRLG
jgi:hypothetical protein